MIIGLTGKSCSGKNYVGSLLKRKGFEVWDLDREAEKIRNKHSDRVCNELGSSDPRIIGDIVFNNPEKLKALENIIYPELTEKILGCKSDIVINGATIFRSGLDKYCSFVIYVEAPYSERLKRAETRDSVSEESFFKRDKAQEDTDYRVSEYRCPVYVLNNNGNDVSSDLDKILAAL